eukprot:scaffold5076_cov153-Skeletonema_marinoi.AAC.1
MLSLSSSCHHIPSKWGITKMKKTIVTMKTTLILTMTNPPIALLSLLGRAGEVCVPQEYVEL